MQAVIMAGGFGTRLRPLTIRLPKPMVPVANRPMMDHIVRLLKRHGYHDLCALLYFQPEHIREYFGDGHAWGIDLTFVMAHDDLGTAGSVALAREWMKDTVVVISGDLVTDFDLTAALAFHREKKAVVTIGLSHVANPLSFGIVICDAQGRVERFLEKPKWGEVFSDTINAGIYIIEPQVLDRIEPGREYDFSKDLFPALLAEGAPLYGYASMGYWKDVGDLEQYRLVHHDVLRGAVQLEIPGAAGVREGTQLWLGERVALGKRVALKGTVILGDDVHIDDGATLEDTIVGARTHIERDALLRRAVIWQDARIGAEAVIEDSTLCDQVIAEARVVVEPGCVVSPDVRICEGARLGQGVRVWPSKTIEAGSVLTQSLVWGDRWSSELFVDARVSGLVNAELTPELATRLGAAYGALLGPGQHVLTSRDPINAARMINRALINGLISVGVDVSDIQNLPIPVTRHHLKDGRYAGGLHIRTSPVDTRRVDIIFFESDGRDLPLGKARSVERLFFREDFPRAAPADVGSIDFPARVVDAYVANINATLDTRALTEAHLKLVIDYGFGGATQVFPAILGKLNLDAVALNAYIDPARLVRTPDDRAKSAEQVAAIVRSVGAHAGFLLDADAEKLEIIDETGHRLDYQRALHLVAELWARVEKPATMAVVASGTEGVDEVAARYSIALTRTRNDHLAMMEAARAGAEFVGGTRGGYIFRKFSYYCDAMYALLKVLELSVRAKVTFGQLDREIPHRHLVHAYVPCPWESKGKVMRRLIEGTAEHVRDVTDGVRMKLDGGWVLVSPDGERPFFHLFAESIDPHWASATVDEYTRKLAAWRDA